MSKIRIQFKDPDVCQDAIEEAARESASRVEGIDDDERETIEEKRKEAFGKLCGKWLRWGEYVTIEIDTDTRTAVVLTVEQQGG